MPTIEQIRAARALLGWSQGELAEQSGLSQTGIARIENGSNQPNSTTLDKITTAFDRADIEFIEQSGVKKRDGEIRTLRGRDGFITLMDEVYNVAENDGGEICLFNGIPAKFYEWLGKDWYDRHATRMDQVKDNFKLKIIVKEGEDLFIANEFAEYRLFPQELFNEQTFYAYGNNLAFLHFKEDNLIIRIMDEANFTRSFKVLFDIAWNNVAKIPS